MGVEIDQLDRPRRSRRGCRRVATPSTPFIVCCRLDSAEAERAEADGRRRLPGRYGLSTEQRNHHLDHDGYILRLCMLRPLFDDAATCERTSPSTAASSSLRFAAPGFSAEKHEPASAGRRPGVVTDFSVPGTAILRSSLRGRRSPSRAAGARFRHDGAPRGAAPCVQAARGRSRACLAGGCSASRSCARTVESPSSGPA